MNRRLTTVPPPGALSLLGVLVLSGAAAIAAEPLFLEGYTDPMSVLPGQEVRFHISTNAKEYAFQIIRVGAADEVVFTQEGLPGHEYPVGDESGRPGNAAMYGCRWPVAFKLTVPNDWRSGYYHVVLRAGGREFTPLLKDELDLRVVNTQPTRPVMFFVVRASPGRESNILLELTSNTYHAYNSWGGSCLYSGPERPRVSFNRPISQVPWSGLFNWELPFLRWAERCGYRVDVCCNLDLGLHPEMLPPYKLVVSVGHDEYWSAEMRDGLETFIRRGGNAAFFSGNTCCWQVRVEDNGRALVCYKRYVQCDPVWKTGELTRLTTLWSDPRLKRPENLLTGVGFVHGGYNGIFGSFDSGPGEGEYTVHRPDHWLFAGTGLRRGQTFGKAASIAGYESDGCEYVLKDGLPVPTGRDGTPKDLEILATAPARWGDFDGSLVWAKELRKALPPGPEVPENHVDRDGGAVLGIFTRGGTVVTAGSCDWAQGLAAKDPVVERITRNILDRLSR